MYTLLDVHIIQVLCIVFQLEVSKTGVDPSLYHHNLVASAQVRKTGLNWSTVFERGHLVLVGGGYCPRVLHSSS